jgi:uncharacterized SAM-binding protein YcdF (DUF218 family)
VIFFAGVADALAPNAAHAALALGLACALAWRRAAPAWLRRGRYLLALVTAWAWVVSSPQLVNRALIATEGVRDDATACRVAAGPMPPLFVVLGSGELWNPDGTPRARLDFEGWKRVRHAVAMWRTHGGTLLLAGGPGAGAEGSLAGTMAAFAAELGVPTQAIRLAGGSQDTREDIAAAAAAVRAHGGPVLLVTSALHMPRARAVAARQGLDLAPCISDWLQIPGLAVNAPTVLPHSASTGRSYALLREWLATIAYRLRGWT